MYSIRHSRDVRVACILLMLLLTGQSVRRIVIDRASGLSNLTSVNTSQATDFSLAAQSLTTTKATEWDLSNQIVDKPEDPFATEKLGGVWAPDPSAVLDAAATKQEQEFANESESQIQLARGGSLLHVQSTPSLRSNTLDAGPTKPDFSGEWAMTDYENKAAGWAFYRALGVSETNIGLLYSISFGSTRFESQKFLCCIEQQGDDLVKYRTWNSNARCQPKGDPRWLRIGENLDSAEAQTSVDPQGNPQSVTPYWVGDALVQQALTPAKKILTTTRKLSGGNMEVINECEGNSFTTTWSLRPGSYQKKLDAEQKK